MNEIHVLDDIGFVRLDDAMADDLSVVNSARVSFAKKSDYEYAKTGSGCFCEDSTKSCDCYDYIKILKEEDQGLIRFLMRERHGTPFEHNSFRFHIKAPLFVFREWQRHRIASYNEWSGRYSELKPEFYVPKKEDWRTQVGKPGAYKFEPVTDEVYASNAPVLHNVYGFAWAAYQKMLKEGVAKEIARIVLPLSIYSEMYWTVNARSLMNFLSLRNDERAMFEIREYAKVVEKNFAEKIPHTAAAFVNNERIAP
jgi:thymidylate synthase (FAD)